MPSILCISQLSKIESNSFRNTTFSIFQHCQSDGLLRLIVTIPRIQIYLLVRLYEPVFQLICTMMPFAMFFCKTNHSLLYIRTHPSVFYPYLFTLTSTYFPNNNQWMDASNHLDVSQLYLDYAFSTKDLNYLGCPVISHVCTVITIQMSSPLLCYLQDNGFYLFLCSPIYVLSNQLVYLLLQVAIFW